MPDRLSSDYRQIPPECIPYNYDRLVPPFTVENTRNLNSVRFFLSETELERVRKLETVYFSPVFQRVVGTFVAGLRRYPGQFCLYVRRYRDIFYDSLLKEFMFDVQAGHPEFNIDAVHWAWFRVTISNGDRFYPLEFHGDIQAWADRMIAVAMEKGTTMGWFEEGRFFLTDGRKIPFGDLCIERLKGGEQIPHDW